LLTSLLPLKREEKHTLHTGYTQYTTRHVLLLL